MMMAYAHERLGVHTFIAKISARNVASRRLFQKLGFRPEPSSDDDDDNGVADADGLLGRPNVFDEVELRVACDAAPTSSPIVEIEDIGPRDDMPPESDERPADVQSTAFASENDCQATSASGSSATPNAAMSASLHSSDNKA